MSEEHDVAEVYKDEWWPVLTCGICDQWVSGDPDGDDAPARPIVHMKRIREDDFTALTTELARYRAVVEAARNLEHVWNHTNAIWVPHMNSLAIALAALDADQPTARKSSRDDGCNCTGGFPYWDESYHERHRVGCPATMAPEDRPTEAGA